MYAVIALAKTVRFEQLSYLIYRSIPAAQTTG